MSQHYFEEEEFSSQFNGQTVLRILSQVKPYWIWVVGFLLAIAVTASAGCDIYLSFKTYD